MRSSFLTLGAFVVGLSACQRTIQTDILPCDLSVSPALNDLGDLPVGTEHLFTLRLAANRAACRVTNVAINNIDGDYFALPTAFDTSEGFGFFQIERDEFVDVELGYFPLREGYHRAQLEVTSDDPRDGVQTVEVRAHADTPAATVTPWTVDFGAVDVGGTGIERVTVRNDSDVRLTVTRAGFSPEAVFGSDEAFPVYVEPRDSAEIEIFARALTAAAQTGSLVLLVGDQPLQNVSLRLNDCRNGVPSAYDRDQDGFTTCGGDCDDDNAAVRPGAAEQPDSVDNDCDGLIDDGTATGDDDGDGYCDSSVACASPAVLPGDCNDGDALVNPGEAEIFGNGIDDDCDGGVDGGTLDYDGDGYTEAAGDCDGFEPTVFPGAPELPDGLDNDCDLFRDEGTALADDDGDGYCEGVSGSGARPCTDGAILGDCNDTDDDSYPTANEEADFRDNDCDGRVDEGTDRFDDDGDGYTELGGDCNDANPSIGPNTLEVPGNGTDDDCNAATPVGQPQ